MMKENYPTWLEGHVITVDGTLKKGPVDADIQG